MVVVVSVLFVFCLHSCFTVVFGSMFVFVLVPILFVSVCVGLCGFLLCCCLWVHFCLSTCFRASQRLLATVLAHLLLVFSCHVGSVKPIPCSQDPV